MYVGVQNQNKYGFQTLDNCSVLRHNFGQNVSEIQAFCSDFRHFCVMSEIWSILGCLKIKHSKVQISHKFGFLTLAIISNGLGYGGWNSLEDCNSTQLITCVGSWK